MNRKRLRRIGCALLFIPWLVVLSSPCVIIALVAQHEIILTHSDLPDHAFRVWVLQERDARGLGIATARRVDPPNQDGLACTIIDVRFFLWEGDAEKAGALPSHQCACYRRAGSSWSPVSLGPEACTLAGDAP